MSQSLAPADDKIDGRLDAPCIVFTSNVSDIFFNCSLDSSITVTSKPSLESFPAMLLPATPAPHIIVFIKIIYY